MLYNGQYTAGEGSLRPHNMKLSKHVIRGLRCSSRPQLQGCQAHPITAQAAGWRLPAGCRQPLGAPAGFTTRLTSLDGCLLLVHQLLKLGVVLLTQITLQLRVLVLVALLSTLQGLQGCESAASQHSVVGHRLLYCEATPLTETTSKGSAGDDSTT